MDVILRKIRDLNPWLLGGDDDIAAMEEEYAELGKRIEDTRKRLAKSD